MKHPDNPVPSGDRTIARATEKMLQRAGFEVTRASSLSTFLSGPEANAMEHVSACAAREIARITQTVSRPDLIFTYHCYYKAPDLIGPAIARHFNVPYVVAEPSSAPKRAQGDWARWHHCAEDALTSAQMLLVTGDHDREALMRFIDQERLYAWPAFIDETLWPVMPRWAHRGHTHLLTVAMMREGDKLHSYRLLADALSRLHRQDWHLTLVGDGPAREQVLSLFHHFGEQVRWRGALEGIALADAYADSELLVWPCVNEALGMIFLEAGLQACPALACNEGGVSSMVCDGMNGRLVPARDVETFAKTLDLLISEPIELARLGEGARAIAQNATVDAAASRFRNYLAAAGYCG